jgi:hypothetical protein
MGSRTCGCAVSGPGSGGIRRLVPTRTCLVAPASLKFSATLDALIIDQRIRPPCCIITQSLSTIELAVLAARASPKYAQLAVVVLSLLKMWAVDTYLIEASGVHTKSLAAGIACSQPCAATLLVRSSTYTAQRTNTHLFFAAK